jgi:CheY-like chemotaxis protein
VEDNDMTRSAVTSLLRQNGAKVKPVASAAAVLEAVLHQPFDVIVCDIAMPGEDGYSVIRKIRALEGGRGQLPAVALTAHMRDEDCARAISSGFQLHLPKSIDGAQLISELEALLRKSGRASYSPPLPEP